MHYKATAFDKDGKYSVAYDYMVNQNHKQYESHYSTPEMRLHKMNETKYIWLQLYLERINRNVKYFAGIHSEYYRSRRESIEKIQEMVMQYREGKTPQMFYQMIEFNKQHLKNCVPPQSEKSFKSFSSLLNNLILFCEIDNI